MPDKSTSCEFPIQNSTLNIYVAIFSFHGSSDNELSFERGEQVEVLEKNELFRFNWWYGKSNEKYGFFPKMYVTNFNPLHISELNEEEVKTFELIGKGGFANVYRAVYKTKLVALKKVFKENETTLIYEANFFWLMRHKNILSLIGITRDHLSLVLEFAAGGSLFNQIQKSLLPLRVIANWALQIAEGMNYLHNLAPNKPIIHRDLKSHNILIAEPLDEGPLESKTLKIADFGLAKNTDNTISSKMAGTLAWLAPEVFKRKISKAIDVWSFGVVVWEMLTSQIPHQGVNKYRLIIGVGNNSIVLFVHPSCPEFYKQILKDCLMYERTQRPSFGELVRRLRRFDSSSLDEKNFNQARKQWIDCLIEESSQKSEDHQSKHTDESEEEILKITKILQNQLNKKNIDVLYNQLKLFISEYLDKKKSERLFSNLILKKIRSFVEKNFFFLKQHIIPINRKKKEISIGFPYGVKRTDLIYEYFSIKRSGKIIKNKYRKSILKNDDYNSKTNSSIHSSFSNNSNSSNIEKNIASKPFIRESNRKTLFPSKTNTPELLYHFNNTSTSNHHEPLIRINENDEKDKAKEISCIEDYLTPKKLEIPCDNGITKLNERESLIILKNQKLVSNLKIKFEMTNIS